MSYNHTKLQVALCLVN